MLFGGMRYNLYLCLMFERLISSMEKRIKYNNYASVMELTNKERRDLAQFCLNYCIKVLGQPKKKGIPTFSIVKTESPYYGQYDGTIEKIYVYYNKCGTIGQFISTFIHEYTHHTQNLNKYEKVLSKVGYSNHPQEIEAEYMAKLYKQSCLELFRKSI